MRSMLRLHEDWFFFKGHPENLKDVPLDAKPVCLPHTWNGMDGQDGGNDYFRGTCCYAKKIQQSELPAGQRYFLEINGANSSADVYLNGAHLQYFALLDQIKVNFDKDELLRINDLLNKIKKPGH